ncbi:stage VI sporulation protein D [Cytobacillus spongiae]|uniref:stage VI sporulation protein D n=1 Tax=Cytobacillus spongiae TaxID=2901381 RepID=UPI001F42D729|nr:stage VI sporulation protein D [Cytobacillus spongiae]UII55064.1 stage VI sporulation protein D [Cytobacillus spongiae]
MSHGNQSCLRFSLEESVWFQKGQEVAELVSISLDPNITIQDNDQYVSIKGSLELTGEYKRSEEGELEQGEVFQAPKFVQSIEDRGEGVLEFSHRFPVDITIPNNRIDSIYDIDVTVETFDYVFPERSCMKLTAELKITGLYGEQQHTTVEEQQQSSVEERQDEAELAYRSVSQSTEVEVEYDDEQEMASQEDNWAPPTMPSVEEYPSFSTNKRDENEHVNNEVSYSEKEEELFTPFVVEARKLPSTNEGEESADEGTPSVQLPAPEISFSSQRNEEAKPADIYQFAENNEEKFESHMVHSEESSSSSSSEEQPKKKKKSSKKNSLSLAEFLARKEEEDDLVKLKVCIVQHGDTIDQLSERYEVSVQQLLRVNHLEINQDVYEGQVLYIPVAVVHK